MQTRATSVNGWVDCDITIIADDRVPPDTIIVASDPASRRAQLVKFINSAKEVKGFYK